LASKIRKKYQDLSDKDRLDLVRKKQVISETVQKVMFGYAGNAPLRHVTAGNLLQAEVIYLACHVYTLQQAPYQPSDLNDLTALYHFVLSFAGANVVLGHSFPEYNQDSAIAGITELIESLRGMARPVSIYPAVPGGACYACAQV
jgi:hypothetical protein